MHTHHHLHDWHIGREDLEHILIGLSAILGLIASTGVIALVIRLASGKW